MIITVSCEVYKRSVVFFFFFKANKLQNNSTARKNVCEHGLTHTSSATLISIARVLCLGTS